MSNLSNYNFVSGNTATFTGNVTGDYIIGNGSQLTGLPAGYSNADVANYLPTYAGNLESVDTVNAATFIGEGGNIGNIQGANVTGAVANATFADTAMVAGTSYAVDGANVTGAVANATFADTAMVAGTAYAVDGANVSGQVANALVSGTVYEAAQPNITSVGTLDNVIVTGDVLANNASINEVVLANYVTANIDIVANGNVTGNFFIGNGSQLTGLPAGYDNADVANYLPTYTGNLDNVSSVGNATTVLFGDGANITGLPAGYSNADVANYLPTYTGNLGNVNSLGTTGNIDTLGDINVSLGNITVGGGVSAATFTGDGGALSNITATNITGQVANALVAGTVYTNAQPNITSVGTLTSLTTIGDVGVTGNITATGNIYGSYLIGDGSKLSGIAPTVQVYEFANIASGVNGYYTAQWLGDYVSGTITTITTTIGTTPTLIGSFITDVGYPGIPTLPIGTNTVTFETQKASGTKFYTCYAEFYKRTTGGTETLINTSDITTAFNLNTKIQQVVSDFVASPITLDVTDRIVIKLYASTTSGTDSITLSFDDNTNSGLQLSVLPASISNFVPYVGSTANLNLGTYSFTTTGNVTGDHIIGEGGNLSNIQGGNVTGAVAFASTANAVAGANVSGTVGSATTAGTVTANAQPNITSVGTLSTLEVTGNVLFGNANIGNLVVTGTTTTANVSDLDVANATIIISSGANALVSNGAGLFVGSESPTVGSLTYLYSSNSWNSSLLFQAPDFTTTGNVTGGSIIGEGGNLSNISGANVTGEVAFAAVANSVDGGNVVGGVFQAFQATRASIANSVSGSNVTGTVGNATYAQIVTSANQPNITQLGTLLDLTVEGTTNLGDVANITITGGSNGQVLTSDGTGAVLWTSYGDANIAAYLASGNDTTGFLTSGDVVANNLVADGGLSAFGEALYYANVTINADANVTGNLLATSVVAATIGNAASVLFGDGSNIAGLSTYTDTDVSLYLASGIDANGYTTTGNITGNFFIGNGSQLTGLPSVTPTTIVNGTSNVSIATTDGNITLTVGGAAVGTISQNSLVYGQFAGAGVGANSIALGYATANITQGIKSVAIGYNAGSNTQGQESVAIGSQAGSNTQGVAAVAVGIEAGLRTQGGTAVAIGAFAGQQGQGANSIAIGSRAGTLNQPANTIIINATGAVFNAVAAQANSFYVNPVRNDTGNTTNVVYYNTSTKEITYGPSGSIIANGTSNVRIATSGGNISFNLGGTAAGFITSEFPLKSSVALGVGAGTLGNGSIAIGYTAGSLNQGYTAIAMGPEAGRDNQGVTAIAIGTQAGLSTQGDQGIAIGVLAGSSVQGANAIAIGRGAGKTNQPANSIIINATGADLNGTNSGLYVAPVRNDTGNTTNVVYYNTSTKEITYGPDAYGNTQVAAYLPTYTGNLGNVANIAATGNITANGNIIVNGTVGTGNISGANNISGVNLLASNAITVGTTVTVLPNSVATFGSNANSYTQITFQNLSNGADATSDVVLTADNGSDTVNFADFGIINSGYDNATPTNSLGNIVFAADSYVYAQGNSANSSQSGGNLAIGATVPTKSVKIFAGGNNSNSIVATFSSTGVSFASPAKLAVYANTTVRDSSITSPQAGMMIYVTGVGMQVRGATAWNTIAGSGT